MSNPLPPKSFLSRNIVTIVMIPSIIGIHLGWLSIQKNRTLVPEGEEKDIPIVEISKLIWKRWTAGEDAKTEAKVATGAATPEK